VAEILAVVVPAAVGNRAAQMKRLRAQSAQLFSA